MHVRIGPKALDLGQRSKLLLLGRFRITSTTPGGARPAHLRDARAHQPTADDCHMLDQDLLGGRGRGGGGGHAAHELPGHERHGVVEQRERAVGTAREAPELRGRGRGVMGGA